MIAILDYDAGNICSIIYGLYNIFEDVILIVIQNTNYLLIIVL